MKREWHQQKMEEAKKRYAEYRAYKAEGHSRQEVADRFGISIWTVTQACKGVCPQTMRRPKNLRNQFTDGKFDRVANAVRYINERTPWLEYAGNFTGVDGHVDVRCKKCGTVFTRAFVSVKHGKARCEACYRRELEAARVEREQKKAAEQEARERQQAERKRQKEASRKCEQVKLKICPICNGLFVGRRTYCSERCRLNNKYALKDGYRYQFPLEEVYERDSGICYLCGKPCDWDDMEEVNGVIVYGNNYPSRDHVIPKSKGGTNSWDNIRLAHRYCNSVKRNRHEAC